MKFSSDIDLDLGDRNVLLNHIKYTSAAMRNVKPIRKHGSGIYVTDVPYDPANDMSAIDYVTGEDRGYVKLDLLNVWLYRLIKDEQHLISLMKEPNWEKLKNRDFVEQLIHVGNHYETMIKMPESIDSIPRLSMFLSVIRPGKKHLIGKSWKEVGETIWISGDDGYSFKKSHAIAYANLVVIHMNLLEQDPTAHQLSQHLFN
jgi:hypothetical protein